MADTGAPWNLPYPLPTDLVRDGAQAIEDLAEATATGLSNIPVLAGIGSNVVQTVKTDPFSTASASYADVTGLTATITPTAATSKVLLVASFTASIQNADGGAAFFRLTGGNAGTYVGDAEGTRTRAATGWRNFSSFLRWDNSHWTGHIIYLDSPETTSAVTYGLQGFATGTTVVYINRTAGDANSDAVARTASSITAIEVAA